MEKRILVTGASGFVGSHICEFFAEKGFKVFGASRKKGFLSEVERAIWLKCDILDLESVRKVVSRGFDVVIHNAGLIATENLDEFWAVNAVGTYNVVKALEELRFKGVFIHISSLAASGPGEKTEDDPCEPVSSYGKSKLFGERIARGSDLDWIVVRPPVVFGERDRGLLKLYRVLKLGIYLKWVPEKYVSLIYVRNLVAFLDFLIEKSPTGEVFFVKDADFRWVDMARYFRRAYGKKFMFPVVMGKRGFFILKPVLSFVSCLTGGRFLVNRDKLEEIKYDRWIAVDRKARSLGFVSPYSLEEAFSRTISWYKERGWL